MALLKNTLQKAWCKQNIVLNWSVHTACKQQLGGNFCGDLLPSPARMGTSAQKVSCSQTQLPKSGSLYLTDEWNSWGMLQKNAASEHSWCQCIHEHKQPNKAKQGSVLQNRCFFSSWKQECLQRGSLEEQGERHAYVITDTVIKIFCWSSAARNSQISHKSKWGCTAFSGMRLIPKCDPWAFFSSFYLNQQISLLSCSLSCQLGMRLITKDQKPSVFLASRRCRCPVWNLQSLRGRWLISANRFYLLNFQPHSTLSDPEHQSTIVVKWGKISSV